jgi:hypothetical protein
VVLYKLGNLMSVNCKGLDIPETVQYNYRSVASGGFRWGGRHQGVVVARLWVTVYTACVSTTPLRMSREQRAIDKPLPVSVTSSFSAFTFTPSYEVN